LAIIIKFISCTWSTLCSEIQNPFCFTPLEISGTSFSFRINCNVVMLCLQPYSVPLLYTSFPQYVFYIRLDKYMCAWQTVTLLSVLKQTIT